MVTRQAKAAPDNEPAVSQTNQVAGLRTADLNGDGKSDLVISNSTNVITVFRSQPGGTFSPATYTATGTPDF